MENFVCDNAKRLWEIFEATGSTSAYRLFRAIQYGKSQNPINDKGMEL